MTIVVPQSRVRPIARRTRGRKHGAITRLISPSDFGEILKPFVFLDLFEHTDEPFNIGLHPHSGIATLTYVMEGSIAYTDPDNVGGVLPAGGVEWMQAGRGMWHEGGIGAPGWTRGFQLWIALPPDLELGPARGICQPPERIPMEGGARVLLGRYKSASSSIEAPSSINYLAVRLRKGERWLYDPPPGHTVLWTAVAMGTVVASQKLHEGELAAFAPSNQPVEFEAETDTEFVVGSAVPHKHDLVLGNYSVHTSEEALRTGEKRILEIRRRLIEEGRL